MEKIIHRAVSDLVPLQGNPRTISDVDFARLVESVKKFGILEGRPLILSDRTGELVVIGGNQRLKAAKHLGIETVPTFLVSGLTEEDERELIIRDNVSNGDWNEAMLREDWNVADLADWGLDLSTWEPKAEPEEEREKQYTTKVEVPVYQPRGERPALSELVDSSKYEELRKAVMEGKLPDDVAAFMLVAASRFHKFDYQKIAEWYAHADKPTQEIAEKLALVIVDFDKAVEHGFVKLCLDLGEQIDTEENATK